VGLIIVGASYFLVAPKFQSGEIQALVMLVGFIVTGAIIGYYSPGITINEASVGGALVMLVMLWTIYFTKVEIHFTVWINLLLLILGVGFSWVGGWAGEKLQGDETSSAEIGVTKFLWKWVLVGVIIGFALNVLFVFLLSTFFIAYIYKFAFAGFIVSFAITGFVVGLKSPGKTLREPALAGVLAVLLDWIFLKFVITLTVPTTYLIIGLFMGFLISFFGAWLGEKYQDSLIKKATV
jgi:MFS family permease